MTDASHKPVPLDLTGHAHLVEGSREFLRLWHKDDGRVLCFINPKPIGPDPFALGIALVDTVRHGARAYARAIGIGEDEAEARIWEGLDAERGCPTDVSHEAEAAPGEGEPFITHTKPGKTH